MNKKFSTLVASLLLATSVGTVGAAASYTSSAALPGNVSTAIVPGQYYQLGDNNQALVMVKSSNSFTLKMVDPTSVDLAQTLWQVTKTTNAEGGISFTFTNKAYGLPLSFSTVNAVKQSGTTGVTISAASTLPGATTLWKWQAGLSGSGIDGSKALASSFAAGDSVMTMVVNGANIAAVKYAVKDGFVAGSNTQLAVAPYNAQSIYLGIDDLNSMLQTQAADGQMQLSFSTDVLNGEANLWTKKYTVVAPTVIAGTAFTAGEKAVAAALKTPIANVDVTLASLNLTAALKPTITNVQGAPEDAITKVGTDLKAATLIPLNAETYGNAVMSSVNSLYTLETKYTKQSDLAKANKTAIVAAVAANLDKLTAKTTIAEYQAQVTAFKATAADAVEADIYDLLATKDEAALSITAASDDLADVIAAYKGLVTETLVGTTLADEYTSLATYAADLSVAINKATSAKVVKDAIAAASPSGAAGDVAAVKADLTAACGDWNAYNAKESASSRAAYYATGNAVEGTVATVTNNYVSLMSVKADEAKDNKYLMVDTAFLTSSTGDKNLKFNVNKYVALAKTSTGGDVIPSVKADLADRYNFRFTYFPTADSIVIEAASASQIQDGDKLWVDRTSVYTPTGKLVKIAALTNTHREVTVGYPEGAANTLNTRIGLNGNVATWTPANLANGVYLFKMISDKAANAKYNGKYYVDNFLANKQQGYTEQKTQDFKHMPAAQWVVEQLSGTTLNTVSNRESAELMHNTSANIQFYTTAIDNTIRTMAGDTLQYVKLEDTVAKCDSTMGYKAVAAKDEVTDNELEAYAFKYLTGLNTDKYINIKTDSVLEVNKDGEKDYFRLIAASEKAQAYGPKVSFATELYRMPYILQYETSNKNVKDEDQMYVKLQEDGSYKLVQGKASVVKPDTFYLKEFKEAATGAEEALECYYTLVNVKRLNSSTGGIQDVRLSKVSVMDYPTDLQDEGLEDATVENAQERTSTFFLEQKPEPLYRRLGVTKADDSFNNNEVDTAKIYLTRNNERFLWENTNNHIAGDSIGINYLGEFNAKQFTHSTAIFVDTAYVRGETNRPQYMLALRPTFTHAKECDEDSTHPVTGVESVIADYLVNLSDSVANGFAKDKNKMFRFEEKTRLAFVPAVHKKDSLIITNSVYTKKGVPAKNDSIYLGKNEFNYVTFQFRLVDNGSAADFYIESYKKDGEYQYVQILNGVPVLTKDIADAERFNIAQTKDVPTDNENLETTEVSVIEGTGKVTIKNAEGKTVAISNILGQALVNTVITSDNATIAVPAGIVVVAIEGEAAVKAVIK